MGDQPDARPLPTQVNTTQKNADTHPCLEHRRQFVPQTARPLGPTRF